MSAQDLDFFSNPKLKYPSLPTGYMVKKYSVSRIHRMQLARGEETCFRTDSRYACKNQNCPLKTECKRKIAAWQR